MQMRRHYRCDAVPEKLRLWNDQSVNQYHCDNHAWLQ